MKLIDIILDRRIRKRVEQKPGEEQQGLRQDRRTTDGMFALRQLVEERLQMQGKMAAGFAVLANATRVDESDRIKG